jgi:transposase-like protein
VKYSKGFKDRMVQRMSGPRRITATALAKEVGIHQPTLSRWLREAHTVPAMGGSDDSAGGESRKPKSTRQWSAEEKLSALQEASTLDDDQLGAFLRREGLHMAQLEEWRAAIVSALSNAKKPKSRKASPESKRIRALEKELNRKEKALAEVAALLALKKRAAEIWGDGDDDTTARSET